MYVFGSVYICVCLYKLVCGAKEFVGSHWNATEDQSWSRVVAIGETNSYTTAFGSVYVCVCL